MNKNRTSDFCTPTVCVTLRRYRRPSVKSLANILKDLGSKFPDQKIQICYEATYLGFSLHRDITSLGYEYFVVAPSSIPRVHGNQVKTDRSMLENLHNFFPQEF